MIFIKNMI